MNHWLVKSLSWDIEYNLSRTDFLSLIKYWLRIVLNICINDVKLKMLGTYTRFILHYSRVKYKYRITKYWVTKTCRYAPWYSIAINLY